MDPRDQAAGQAIRNARADDDLSPDQLAQKVRQRILELRRQLSITAGVYDFKTSYLLQIERGDRPLPAKGLVARALLEVLPKLPEKHQRRIAACGLGLSEWRHENLGSNALSKSPEASPDEVYAFLQTMQKGLGNQGNVLDVPREQLPWAFAEVLYPWAHTRCNQMHCNMTAAIKWAKIAGDNALVLEEDRRSEGLSMVLLDVASAFHCAGRFEQSKRFASPARSVAVDEYRQASPVNPRRIAKAVARTYLMEQTIGYYQNDEPLVLRLENTTHQYLEQAGDLEGYAKCLNTVALMRFEQGRWDDAWSYGQRSAQWVDPRHQTDNDPVWSARDFSAFKMRWWYFPTQSLLFDIKACTGEYWQLPESPTLERDFPPFVPRYEWVQTRKTKSSEQIEARLRFWEAQAQRDDYVVYLPDIYISHGDFLAVTGRADGAQKQYRLAVQSARANGLRLVEKTAQQRLNDGVLPPGLAILAENLRLDAHAPGGHAT